MRKSDGRVVYCPSGHEQFFTETEVSALKKELARAQGNSAFFKERSEHYRASMVTQENRARGLKSALTLTKKRIAAGKCPCCSKQFADLRDHVANAHPQYKAKVSK